MKSGGIVMTAKYVEKLASDQIRGYEFNIKYNTYADSVEAAKKSIQDVDAVVAELHCGNITPNVAYARITKIEREFLNCKKGE
jgi:hypothetical protein